MYSPYPATIVFAVLHTIFFTIACFMHSCELEGAGKHIYNAMMTLGVGMEVLLLFSIAMGVGASGYDSSTKNCFLLQ